MRVLKIIILHRTARWVLVAVKTIVVILVVIHPTEFLDHLASAVMIAIGCATVAATAEKPLLTDTTAGTNAAIA